MCGLDCGVVGGVCNCVYTDLWLLCGVMSGGVFVVCALCACNDVYVCWWLQLWGY